MSRRAQENQGLVTHIRACYQASRGRYGTPRIHQELQAQGFRVSRHRVARLMRLHDIRSISRRRVWRARAGAPPEVAAANTLRREFLTTRPNEKWAGDITYVPTRQGWLYVVVLMDLYPRRIVGWAMGKQMTTTLTLRALEMALQQRPVPVELLHHSDRGCQYVATLYQQRLIALGIRCSMSRPGNCWGNAVVESFFATLKTEVFHGHQDLILEQARTEIFAYLEGFYNRVRRHSTLGYLSPAEFEQQAAYSTTGVH